MPQIRGLEKRATTWCFAFLVVVIEAYLHTSIVLCQHHRGAASIRIFSSTLFLYGHKSDIGANFQLPFEKKPRGSLLVPWVEKCYSNSFPINEDLRRWPTAIVPRTMARDCDVIGTIEVAARQLFCF